MRWMLKLGMKIAKAFENNGVAQESNAASGGKYDLPGMPELARRAAEGMVLLRNDGVLPLRPTDRVALFGRCQVDTFYVGYGSGGDVKAPYKVCYLDALQAAEKRGRAETRRRIGGDLPRMVRKAKEPSARRLLGPLADELSRDEGVRVARRRVCCAQ